jgi:AraC-like DNA-binding protein
MRLPRAAFPEASRGELPPWPPLLATRGPGSRSAPHAHHAIHVVVCASGELRFRGAGAARWRRAPGVLTAPDVAHAIDARGAEVLIVFLDPESEAGRSLRSVVREPLRALSAGERELLAAGAEPLEIMRAQGVEWTARAVAALGGARPARSDASHPRVRRLLGLLRTLPPDADTSLEALARAVSLSPGRLMHAFTASIGIPLRPYLGWLRLQRAAAGIAAGRPLAEVAHAAGFADSAHMTRTFRRMFGVVPSELRRGAPADGAQRPMAGASPPARQARANAPLST